MQIGKLERIGKMSMGLPGQMDGMVPEEKLTPPHVCFRWEG
jgi:hypothetical protein